MEYDTDTGFVPQASYKNDYNYVHKKRGNDHEEEYYGDTANVQMPKRGPRGKPGKCKCKQAVSVAPSAPAATSYYLVDVLSAAGVKNPEKHVSNTATIKSSELTTNELASQAPSLSAFVNNKYPNAVIDMEGLNKAAGKTKVPTQAAVANYCKTNKCRTVPQELTTPNNRVSPQACGMQSVPPYQGAATVMNGMPMGGQSLPTMNGGQSMLNNTQSLPTMNGMTVGGQASMPMMNNTQSGIGAGCLGGGRCVANVGTNSTQLSNSNGLLGSMPRPGCGCQVSKPAVDPYNMTAFSNNYTATAADDILLYIGNATNGTTVLTLPSVPSIVTATAPVAKLTAQEIRLFVPFGTVGSANPLSIQTNSANSDCIIGNIVSSPLSPTNMYSITTPGFYLLTGVSSPAVSGLVSPSATNTCQGTVWLITQLSAT
jgi:hypothetical protein